MPPPSLQMGFYHLTRTTPDAALPELLGRTLAAGQRALILCASTARVAAIDAALWAANSPNWLPHGHAATGHAALQPIWITETPADANQAPNAARYLFLLDGQTADFAPSDPTPSHRTPADPIPWDRIFDLFDGTDPAQVAAARQRWTAAKSAGHDLTYWKQTETGWTKG